MKKHLLSIVLLLVSATLYGQVSVTATLGTTSASYTTVKLAFDAINLGTHRGVITISLTGNTTENATAALNASGSGSASYTAITISPSGGATRTITGTVASAAMIKLNGADNVTIDGLNTGGDYLSMENYSTTGATILFTNDATSNTVTNCLLKGNNTSTYTEQSGIVCFGNAAAAGTGNDNNTISNCAIGDGINGLYNTAIWGYNTTAATFNNNETISNNNIYNFYFDAASGQVSSNGVYVYDGNSDWTISGNNFYNTTSRTPSNYSVYNCIYLRIPLGNGFNILNNYFGYTSAAHTGTWTVNCLSTSTSWNSFAPIIMQVGSTTASSVQGNTIANISYTTGGNDNTYGKFTGIYVAAGSKVNIGNITGNTIGSTTGNSITVAGGSVYASVRGINYLGVDGVSISNNTVGGFTVSPATSGMLYGLNLQTSGGSTTTCNSNTIGSTTVTNSMYVSSSSATMSCVGISLNSVGVTTLNNNTVANLTNNSTSGTTTGILFSGGAGVTISQNVVNNLRANSYTTTPQSSVLAGIDITSTGVATVSGNTIHTLKQINATVTASYGSYVYGMNVNSVSSAGTSVFEKNFIHTLTNPSTTGITYQIMGVYMNSGKMEWRNNMIRLGYDETGTNINATPIMDGIFSNSSADSLLFYNNTIYLGGSYNGTASRDQNCFRIGSRPMVIKNNIFQNVRALTTPSTFVSACLDLTSGTTICEGPNSVSIGNTSIVLDNNIYYYSGNATILMRYYSTLSSWQLYTRQDNSSIMADPKLKTPAGTSATVDLHIDNAQPSPAEGAGQDLPSVTTDIDGEDRSTLTPVDIGADAGSYTGYDVYGPGIQYSPMSYRSGTLTDRTLSGVRFFDPNGIATGGTAPRIYYKKNAGSWYSNAGSLVSSTSTSAVYDFTILAADMGGLLSGDIVYYYVVAQESTGGYLSSWPVGVVGTNVNSITTAPSTLYSYVASVTLAAGTYQIGSSQPVPFNTLYNAITAAGVSAITGPVVFELTDAAYTFGSSTAVFAYNSDLSAVNTFTLRPASGVSPVVTGTIGSGALIQIVGSDYITIDGSNNGTTSQDLTFVNSTGGGSIFHLANNGTTCGGGGATYITIKNTIMMGGSTSAGFGIVTGSATIGFNNGDNHDYNTFTNNLIQKVGTGISVNSAVSGYSDNLTITNNTIGSATAANYVGIRGIALTGCWTSTVSGNKVFNVIENSADPVGIDLYANCSSVIVEKNAISGIKTTAAGYGAKGIRVNSNSNTVRNNLIFDIGGTGSTTASNYIAGIYNVGTSNVFYYNTVYMTGDYNGNSTSVNLAMAFYNSGATGVDVRNNIFHNQIDPLSANVNAKTYAVYFGAAPAFCNFNDYYVAGQNPVLGYLTSDRATLANIRTATGQDLNSANTDPLFANAGGTAIADYTPSAASLFAMPISGITTDILGASRGATYAAQGAIEYTVTAPVIVTVNASAGTATANYINLKAAFDAINAGTHQGVISVVINASTSEYTTATLYQSGYGGTSSYTSIQIYPSVTGLSVNANIAMPMIDFNGAANVTLDGSVMAGHTAADLVLINSSTSNTAGTSTIRFINDANTNTVQYCTIKGSTTETTGGVVFFSTTTGTNGNDGNTITYNNLTNAADANRPLNMIGSIGTASKDNSGNIISNNNFYDFLSRSAISFGTYIQSNNTGWTITGNSFYETASFVPAGTYSYYGIYINNSAGGGYTISNNYVGGSSPNCGSGGIATGWTKTNASSNNFNAIYVSVGTAVASSIQGNTIRNFTYANNAACTFTGISLVAGTANIGTVSGNVIGASTGNGSIAFSITAASGASSFYGISINGTGNTVFCQNDTIGSVTLANSSTQPTNFYGIATASSGTVNISNNLIGSAATANSINQTGLSNLVAQTCYGIYASASGSTQTINNNLIANLTNGTTSVVGTYYGTVIGVNVTSGSNTITNNQIHDLTIANTNTSNSQTSSAQGISLTNSGAFAQNITGNTIYNITNTKASFTGYVLGIYYYGGSTASYVSRNFIYGIAAPGAGSTANIQGIALFSGVVTSANNVVLLGNSNTATIQGIYSSDISMSSTSNIYFNTVYISGSPATGALNSYAYYSGGNSAPRNIRNNIFYNARTNSGATGKHYTAYFAYGTPGTLVLSNNDYYAPGTGGVLGYYNSLDVTSVPLITAQDAGSFAVDPLLTNPGTTTAADYTATVNTLNGISGTGVINDYTNTNRGYNSMGAFDYAVTYLIKLTATSGTLMTNYSNIKHAFDGINAGLHNGAVTISLYAGSTETAAAVLNASGSGSASYTSVNVYPVVSGLTITGTLATPLIDLNGADNVTFDGRVNATGTSRDLIIVNTSTASTAATSTFRFINDAQNNTIKYCNIRGSSTDVSGGMILFSTAGAGTGNTGNLVDSCDITKNAAAQPKYIVYSNGTAAKDNICTISNSNFYEFSGMAIWVGGNSKNWTVSGNSIYQTSTVTVTTGQTAIRMHNDGHSVFGNYIGGSAPQCGGTAFTVNSAGAYSFYGVDLEGSSTPTTRVYSNYIRNFNITAVNSVSPFTGIYMYNGNANVGTDGANYIGDTTGTGNIIVNNNYSGGGGSTSGIYVSASTTGTKDIRNNYIGSFTLTNSYTTSGSGHKFYGIIGGGNGSITFANNMIGSIGTALNINATNAQSAGAAASNQEVMGIYSLTNGAATITGNTIANLNNNWQVSTSNSFGLTRGIYLTNSSGAVAVTNNRVLNLTSQQPMTAINSYGHIMGICVYVPSSTGTDISGNTVSGITNTSASYSGNLAGIYYYGPTTGTHSLKQNYVYGLSVSGATSTAANIYGIQIEAGSTTISNNLVQIGEDTKTTMYGIYEYGGTGTNNIYFNTVHIRGTLASGTTNKSYAFYSSVINNTRNFRNNVFSNIRSTTGGANLHYAMYIVTAGGTLTADYNDYYVAGTGGTLGYYGANKTVLPIVTAQDSHSLAIDPVFANNTGTLSTDYMQTVTLRGVAGTGITVDLRNVLRGGSPNMGAFEVIGTLPVRLLSFTGTSTAAGNLLEWKTENEQNGKEFELQRSTNGQVFLPIATFAVRNNTGTRESYQYTDARPATGPNYYRLKETDADGKTQYSTVVLLLNNISNETVSIFPNPTSGKITIAAASGLNNASVILRDMGGRTIQQQKGLNGNFTTMDLSALPGGIYVVQLINNDQTKQFLVHKQ